MEKPFPYDEDPLFVFSMDSLYPLYVLYSLKKIFLFKKNSIALMKKNINL